MECESHILFYLLMYPKNSSWHIIDAQQIKEEMDAPVRNSINFH